MYGFETNIPAPFLRAVPQQLSRVQHAPIKTPLLPSCGASWEATDSNWLPVLSTSFAKTG